MAAINLAPGMYGSTSVSVISIVSRGIKRDPKPGCKRRRAYDNRQATQTILVDLQRKRTARVANLGRRARMSKSNTEKSTVVPRLLTRQQAAAYCGVSVPIFEGICPVNAIALGNGKRLKRFDRVSLDRWIDSLDRYSSGMSIDWLAELERR
jgi:hypothetical protein